MLSFRFPYPDMSCLKRSGDGIIEGWPLALTVNKDSSNSMHVYAKEEKVPRKRRRDKVWEVWEVLFVIFFSHLLFYLLFFVVSFLFLQCSYSIGVLGHAGDGFWTCLCLRLPVPLLFQVSTSYRLHAQRIGGSVNSCFCFFPKAFVLQLWLRSS